MTMTMMTTTYKVTTMNDDDDDGGGDGETGIVGAGDSGGGQWGFQPTTRTVTWVTLSRGNCLPSKCRRPVLRFPPIPTT